jgi:two-component system, cell cycle response regulator
VPNPPDPDEALPPVPDPETLPTDVGQRAWLPPTPPRAGLLVIQGRTLGRLYALVEDETVLGRAADAGIVLDDAGVSRRHARIQRRIDDYVIYDLESRNGVFVNADQVQERVLQDGDRVQLGTGTVLKFRLHDAQEEEAQRRLYESATRDLLTGAANRRRLMEALESEVASCERHGVPLSVLLLDLDHFKAVNDRVGHLGGDHALRSVAEAAQAELRAGDLLGRFGGEEFAVVLRHAGRTEARKAAERIRRRVEGLELTFEGAPIKLTVSLGVATLAAKGGAQALLAAADAALYRAKREGRNRVTVAGG